eukprot:CAMPEP_0170536240 /NCGR_PEP_ID=MMETSP0209-20121228/102040_1 /TAXON_ID=665100 ORGANISM="Litonotus pictus, Strain P1" /NCGR_SAMPLE_ID=MMETSP0209 /ASSEMBLY_ACC=CAM_ASM_000301 /LENGTH=420 /DNA_ID=CAMNT_0010837587 /DNA_START=376 /DNA_END=1639 /DNA_ORIENTATION=-
MNDYKNLISSNSIYGILEGESKKFFEDEYNIKLRHNSKGIVGTSNPGANLNSSTFYITLAEKPLSQLDDKHTIFGKVEEGLDVLDKINGCILDENNQPYQNIRIKHTVILEDPFQDSEAILQIIPSRSPLPVKDLQYNRLEDDFNIDGYYNKIDSKDKLASKLEEHEAKSRAIALTLLEDLPDADVKPPENVLFICKLNPITQDEDLEEIFSGFGVVKSCKIVRDPKTGMSQRYGFIEFEHPQDCEAAYLKMNGATIDDRKIKVDFSQSVNKSYSKIKKVMNTERDYNEKNKRLEEENRELVFDNKKLVIVDSNAPVGKRRDLNEMVVEKEREKGGRGDRSDRYDYRTEEKERDRDDMSIGQEKVEEKRKERESIERTENIKIGVIGNNIEMKAGMNIIKEIERNTDTIEAVLQVETGII